MKLNLGCGKDYIKGYVNVDYKDNPCKKDVEHDLNKAPYPFKDNSIDEVRMIQVLEHLDNEIVFRELYRICKSGALIHIEVPFSINGFNHIQHRKYYDWNTFRNLEYKSGTHFTTYKFKLLNQKPLFYGTPKNLHYYRRFIPFSKFLSNFFPVIVPRIVVELKVIK
jgi:predicted SAM-dependent methyltransferase